MSEEILLLEEGIGRPVEFGDMSRALERGALIDARKYLGTVMSRNNIEAYSEMSKLEVLDRNYKKARLWFSRVLKFNYPAAQFNNVVFNGTVCSKAGKAVEILKEMQKEIPDNVTLYLTCGDYLLKQKKLVAAVRMFEQAHEKGNLAATIRLAGIWAKKDNEKSIEYYKIAAEGGDVASMLEYGIFCVTERKLPEAVKWLTKAADKGSARACMQLAELYFVQYADYPKATKYYLAAFVQATPRAGKRLIQIYAKTKDYKTLLPILPSLINEFDKNDAIYLAAILLKEQDFLSARVCYEFLYNTGTHTEDVVLALGDIEKAEGKFERADFYYDQAIGQGSAVARVKKANLLYSGYKKYFEAAKEYDKIYMDYDVRTNPKASVSPDLTAEHFNKMALNLTAIYYTKTHDIVKGQLWYKRALESREDVDFQLAKIFLEDCDFESAKEWFIRSMKNGNNEACLGLAKMYDNNFTDYEKAKQFYSTAITNGSDEAKYLLAVLYLEKTNERTLGIKCLESAAVANYVPAILKLAGLERTENNNHKYALELYEKAAALGSLEGKYKAAEINFKLMEYERALEIYESLYEQDPSVSEQIAVIYLKHKRDFPRAVRWYQTVLQKQGIKDKDTLIQLAMAYAGTGERDEAIKCLKKAIELGSIVAINEIANIYKNNKEYDLAEQWYEKGNTAGNADSYHLMAKMYHYTLQNYVKAKEIYERALKTNTSDELKNDYKILLVTINNLEETERKYKMSIEKGKYQMVLNLAKTYEKSGDFLKAKETYLQAAASGVLESDVHLAELFENKIKDYELAEHHYLQAELKGQAKTSLAIGNMLNYKVKDYVHAEKYYEKALREGVGGSAPAFELGKLNHYNFGNFQEAQAYYIQAMKMGNVDATYYLGVLYDQMGDKINALSMFESAVKSGHKLALLARAQIYEKAGQLYDAIRCYTEAVNKGLPKGAYMLGVIYARDFRDEPKAREWLNYASMNGIQEAMTAYRLYFPDKFTTL